MLVELKVGLWWLHLCEVRFAGSEDGSEGIMNAS